MSNKHYIKLSLRATAMCATFAITLCVFISLLFSLYIKETGLESMMPLSILNIGKNADAFDVKECQSNDESYSCERTAQFYKKLASSIDDDWLLGYQQYVNATDWGIFTPYMMRTERIRLFTALKQPISFALTHLDEGSDHNAKKQLIVASDTITLLSISMLTTLMSAYIAICIAVMLLVWWVVGISNIKPSSGRARILPSYAEMSQISLMVTVGAMTTSVIIASILGVYFKHATLDYISQFSLL
jgi:hypothetical protein